MEQGKYQETLTSSSPGFIKKFFASSRLHHISTWKSDIVDYVAVAMKSADKQYKSSRPEDPNRIIMHIDMDCFFASVAIRDRPQLKDKPVAVAHSIGGIQLEYSSSEIASCNYKARERGIRNGMFVGSVKKVAPDLIIVPYEFEKYDQCSKQLYQVLLKYANYVQAISCDEAYIDITESINNELSQRKGFSSTHQDKRQRIHHHNHRTAFPDDGEEEEDDDDIEQLEFDLIHAKKRSFHQQNPQNKPTKHLTNTLASTLPKPIQQASPELLAQITKRIAETIRAEIFHISGGCTASVGIAHNLLLARVATKQAKPNGVYYISPSQAIPLLQSLSIKELPGIGDAVYEKCQQYGMTTCGDLQRLSTHSVDTNNTRLIEFQSVLGEKTSQTLLSFAQGDDRRCLENKARQSIGSDINWGIRFHHAQQVQSFVHEFCEEIIHRTHSIGNISGFMMTTPSNQMNGPGESSSSSSKVIQFQGSLVTVSLKERLYEGEPGKFLGCGHCMDHCKSFQHTQVITTTAQLYPIVNKLVQEINVPVEKIRGVGIHIKKGKEDPGVVLLPTTTTNTIGLQCEDGSMDSNRDDRRSGRTVGEETKKGSLKGFLVNTTMTPVAAAVAEPVPVLVINEEKREAQILCDDHRSSTNRTSSQTIDLLDDDKHDEVLTVSLSPSITATSKGGMKEGKGSGLDMEVFLALPSDIQAEIQAQYHHLLSSSTTTTTSGTSIPSTTTQKKPLSSTATTAATVIGNGKTTVTNILSNHSNNHSTNSSRNNSSRNSNNSSSGKSSIANFFTRTTKH